MAVDDVKVNAVVPYYGGNRRLAEHVGRALDGRFFVAVPFAGGMSELRHITARTLLVGDLHRHVINLARVAADAELNAQLRQRLADLPFHPDVLTAAQDACLRRERGELAADDCPLSWATDYFVASWMARNGRAGTKSEFGGGLSVRWDGGGGDSAVRFRSATESLAGWQAILRRCTFVVMNVFDMLQSVRDRHGNAVYCDSPFPGPGDEYAHRFTEDQHRALADRLAKFERCRVVARFYDVPLARELYPESAWEWKRLTGGRKATNEAAPEVLLINRT